MVAESGARLLDEDAVEALLRELLVPRATVVTPNLAEARVLAGRGRGGAERGARPGRPRPRPRAVVVTGGHREEATDVFFDGGRVVDDPG